MSKTLFLKPAPGRSVDRPETREPWPEDGMDTESTLFVRRRLKDGDLVEAEQPTAQAKTSNKTGEK